MSATPSPPGLPPPSAATPASTVTVRFHVMSYLLGLLTALMLVGGTLLLSRQPELQPIQLQLPPTPAPTETALPTPTPGPIVVFVSGAVQRPGMYALASGTRVGDAIASAGGLLASADPALVNQAQVLYDGAQVHVPGTLGAGAGSMPLGGGETGVPVVTAANVVTLPPVGLSGELPASTRSPDSRAAGVAADSRININTASVDQLDTLPGIGLSRAQSIIDGRPYQTVDDLDRVPGIGATTLDRLRDLVTVGP